MFNIKELILEQKRRYYPTGRAFRMRNPSFMYSLHDALAISEEQSYKDSVAILDSLLPDSDRFTEDDATDWERRLGMISNASLSLATRKLAIRRKMAAPGTNPAHGHYLFIQSQLQAAGFNVWVHENLFPTYPSGYTSVSPKTIYGTSNFKSLQYGQKQYGAKFGGYYNNIIANSIYQAEDNSFSIGNTFASTFFIGGQILGTYATIDAAREIEFRQLVLQLKQVQSIAFAFINYI